MRIAFGLTMLLASVAAHGDDRASPTEAAFRVALGVAENVNLFYRNLDCSEMTFEAFTEAMHAEGVKSEVERAIDGSSVTLTVRRPGGNSCPSPYAPVTEMPPFEMRDLAGKRVTSAALKGKPTLINFYFAQCVPCILEVGPINGYAAQHPEMNFLAVTFDEAPVARAFVDRYQFRWRVAPDARDFIDRMKVKQYPMMALFDSSGRLLGTRRGGVRDELEAATVAPQLARWVDGLLRVNRKETSALSGK
ncbi:MAG TPA: TlpA disulfide reductase family protein [Steroidobacteraceae bacterium]|nr:TlpA disulfide reductase family protein [Steroidobacteraceae bacterium]